MKRTYWLIILFISFATNRLYAQGACKGTSNKVDFSVGTPLCKGQAISFTITSAATDSPTYEWRWGDGSPFEAVGNTTHTFASAGSKTVVLVRRYTSPSPCEDSIKKTFVVNDLPLAPVFTFNPANPCGQANTTFAITAPDAATVYTWNFGDASSGSSNTATGTNVSHAFTPTGATSGNYNVTVTATKNGCSTTAAPVSVPVKATPLININTQGINASNFRRCLAASDAETVFNFQFRNTSNADPNTTYTWNWGDGSPNEITTSLTPNIFHTYNIGVYTFVLTAKDNVSGCTSTFTKQLVYEKDPSGAIIIPANLVTLCEGDTMRVTFSTQNATSYTLYWADGDSLETTSTGPHKHVYKFNSSQACNLPPNVTTGFSRFMKLVSKNNCNTQTATSEFRTKIKAKPNFTVPANLCLSGGSRTVNFTNTSCPSDAQTTYLDPIAQYDWDFGDPASGASNTLQTFSVSDPVSHTYTAAGVYNVKLTATNSCGAKDTIIQVTVGTQTQASFLSGMSGTTAVTSCSGTPIDLTPAAGVCLPVSLPLNSTSTGGGNLTWTVSGGTGFTFNSTNSSSAVDTLNFTKAGTYTVTLTSSNSCGSPTSSCATITIKGKPTPTPADIGGLSAFAQPANAQFPNGYYASCGATAIAPTTTPKTGETYAWSVIGTNGTPNPTGNTGTGTTPNFTLPVGQYNLNLTPSNSCGAAAQPATVPFIVTNPPVAQASTAPRPAAGQPKQVKICPATTVNLGVGTPATNVTYSWAVTGGGAGVTSPNSLTTTTTNSTVGTYLYVLTATDQLSNCVSKDTVQVLVNPRPVIKIGGDALADTTVCLSTVPFGMKATPNGGGWKGQGGISAAGSFTPNTIGSYAVRYGVTDANGCTDTLTANITVVAPPVISFAGNNFTFCNTPNTEPLPTPTANAVGTGVWSCPSVPAAITFSGGQYLINPSVALGAAIPPQNVVIRYTFTAAASPNCITVKDTIVRIIGSPSAEAGANKTVCADAAPFTITGTPTGGIWSGSGVASNGIFTPSSVPANTSTGYLLTYTIGGGSCSASDTMRVFVKPLPTIADSIATPTAVCIDKSPYLLTDYKQINGTVSWSGTGLPVGLLTFDNTSHLYEIDPSKGVAGTTYTLTFTYTETGSAPLCVQTKTKQLTINVLPVVTVQNANFCKNTSPVTMPSFSPTTGGTGIWTNVTSPTPTPNITVNANGTFVPNETGTFTLRYTFTDNNGCVSFKDATVVISEPTTVEAGVNDTVCVSDAAFNLTGFSPAGGQWTGTGITNINGTFDPAVAGVGVFTLKYTTNPSDPLCERHDTKTIRVKPLPVITDTVLAARTPSEVCIDKAKYVLSDYKRANGTVSWSGVGLPVGLLTFDALQNVYEFDPSKGIAGTTYTLTFTYTENSIAPQCSNTHTKTIKINPLPVVLARDTTFCRSLTATSVQLANFSPTVGGTGVWTNITTPAPVPNITLNANGSFVPNALGNFTFRYTFTDGTTACQSFKDISVNITEPVTVEAGNNLVMCVDTAAANFILPSFSPAGGTWSGTAVSLAGVFTPRNANPSPSNPNGTTYKLVYSVGAGLCLRKDSITVRVKPLPSVNAGANQDTICYFDAPLQLSTLAGVTPTSGGTWSGTGITNNSTGIFDPKTAVGATPPTTPQTFTISYNFRAANSCDSTHTKTIVVNPMPVARFDTLTPRAIYCKGVAYTFPNTSIVPAGSSSMTYLWDFGDGVLRPSLPNGNGQFTFTSTGFKNITLYAKSQKTCWDTLTLPIRVVEPAVPNFTFNKPVSASDSCAPKVVIFTNQTTGFEPSYQWNFGNGVTSTLAVPPPVTYLPSKYRDTTYYITLTTPNSCGTPIKRDSITVHPVPTAGFSYDKIICAGFPLTIYNTSYGKAKQYKWTFGDAPSTVVTTFPVNPPQQNTVIHAFQYSGKDDTTYVVKLIALNECGSDTLIDSIKVKANEVKAFFALGNDSVGCAPYTITLTSNQPQGTSNALTWFWGDNTSTAGGFQQAHTFTAAGTYKVRLAVVNGCNQDTITRNIHVKPKPIAAFAVNKTNTCKGDTIYITNNSSSPSGLPIKYLWDYGDGTTSTQNPPPPKVYTNSGNYTISLTVTENVGAGTVACEKIATQNIVIGADSIVKAKLGIDTARGCEGLPVTFTNQTSGNNPNFVIFGGNGNIATTSPVTFVYNTAGTYFAYMKVIGSCNTDSTAKVAIKITPKPQAAFAVSQDSICLGDTLHITNNTLNQGNFQFFWDFGDATTSDLNAPPVKMYTTAGIYTITMRVVSFASAGVPSCTTFVQKTIKVRPLPTANFATVNAVCEGTTVTFQNLSTNAVQYLWDFGVSGSALVGTNVSYTYTTSGVFNVRLIAYNSVGCTDTLYKQINVFPKASPDFSMTDTAGCSDLTVNFTNTSPYPTIAQGFLKWDFGNGNTFNGFFGVPAQTYTNTTALPKIYTVKLIATTAFGCKDSVSKQITVYPTPKAGFTIAPNDTLLQSNATFTFQNTTTPTGSWSYIWNYGDNTPSDTVTTTADQTHSYDSLGTYTVTLIAVSDKGCSTSVSHSVTVLPVPPQANFEVIGDSAGCAPFVFQVQNTSRFGQNYFWDFGNGVRYELKNPPPITYYDAGKYTVRLVAVNPSGVDTLIRSQIVTVYDRPIAAFRVNPKTVILPNKLLKTLNISRGDTVKARYFWEFGDSTATVEGFEPSHLYTKEGVYTIRMVMVSQHGCTDTTVIDSAVTATTGGVLVVPNAFTPRGGNLPSPDNLNDVFLPLTDGAVKYSLKIFSRWGEMLFESDDPAKGWDGYHRGQLCTQDVYAYKVEVTFADGTKKTKVGDVTLLR
ncbi:gliding motility-associated C-terminal domain-containing protein [Flexibacter flexilis DSM 6793]|uniref:Gliding motility-associated C-terminal domain-containing protein n=1 Tax=Flexibacter flexilis DSM 6793 TaxID=927664 RepID=A0A1I1HLR8_9BACT|nr:PKD domain-containing protein [Flexibacter flexilis]SFC24512.1 gliding motility-associated C-terminal domain-containing protein [Flexibacter flexilis DSM 6793]